MQEQDVEVIRVTDTLVLHLKKKWFDEIESGKKVVEYRKICDYWKVRLENHKLKRIQIILGYPSILTDENCLGFVFNGFFLCRIKHPEFGNVETDVFAIPLTERIAKVLFLHRVAEAIK